MYPILALTLLLISSIGLGQSTEHLKLVQSIMNDISMSKRLTIREVSNYIGWDTFDDDIEYYEGIEFNKKRKASNLQNDKQIQFKMSYYDISLFFEAIEKYIENNYDNVMLKNKKYVIKTFNDCYSEDKLTNYFQVEFSNAKSLYFAVDIEHSYISNIFNDNFEDIMNYLYPEADKEKYYLFQRGTINDSDGYSNFREGPGNSFKVVGTFSEDEEFFYVENKKSNWWFVSQMHGLSGYLHKSRIKPCTK